MQYCTIHEQEFIEAWPDTLICDECYALNMGGKEEEDGECIMSPVKEELFNGLTVDELKLSMMHGTLGRDQDEFHAV